MTILLFCSSKIDYIYRKVFVNSNIDIKNSSDKIERTCSISSVILYFRIEPILSVCNACVLYSMLWKFYSIKCFADYRMAIWGGGKNKKYIACNFRETWRRVKSHSYLRNFPFNNNVCEEVLAFIRSSYVHLECKTNVIL